MTEINVSTRNAYTHSDERFDHYDIYMVFTVNGTIVSESVVSKWGVPKGHVVAEDAAINNFRDALQIAINAALKVQP